MEQETSYYATEGAISYGWSVMKRKMLFYAGLTFAAIFISGYTGWLVEISQDSGSFFFTILNNAINIFIQLGFTIIFLHSVREGFEPSINDFCMEVSLYLDFVLATILYTIIVVIGTFLLIVPGVIWGIKYGFFAYCMIDEDLSAVESLKRSAEITQGAKWDIFKFYIMAFLVNLLGVLAFGVGLLLTVPATGIAYAYVYCNLVGATEAPMGENGEPDRPHADVQVFSARKR